MVGTGLGEKVKDPWVEEPDFEEGPVEDKPVK